MEIDIKTLQVFRTLVETTSFTKTAARHGLSQPAISNLVGKLENDTGLVLFERKAAGASLTSVGERFHAVAIETCEAHADFVAGVCRHRRQLANKVLIGVDGSRFGKRLLAHHDSKKSGTNHFRLVETGGSWRADLQRGNLDLVVAGRFLRGDRDPMLQSATILSERGITIAWNPAFFPFDQTAFCFPDILVLSLLIPSEVAVEGFATKLRVWCQHAYGMTPANIVEFRSEEEARAAAEAGLGIWISPGNAAPHDATSGTLAVVRTFEFLLPEAYLLEIHCRSEEEDALVLKTAAALAKECRKICE